jgi:hypothetical protein
MGARVGDSDPGLLLCALAGARIREVIGHLGLLPESFIENAVDEEGTIDFEGSEGWDRRVGIVMGPTGERQDEEDQRRT